MLMYMFRGAKKSEVLNPSTEGDNQCVRPVCFLSLCMSLILLVKRICFVDILLVKPNFRDAQGIAGAAR